MKGMCRGHYQAQYRGNPNPKLRGPNEPDYKIKPFCQAPDCMEPAHTKGYCKVHYMRVRRTGVTEIEDGRPILLQILQSVEWDSKTGCWFYMGALNTAGYGLLRGKLVHRVVYGKMVSPIDRETTIDHLCRNRVCCNPAHLEEVSGAENARRRKRSVWESEILPRLLGEHVYEDISP